MSGRSQFTPAFLLVGAAIGAVVLGAGCAPDRVEPISPDDLRVHRGTLVQRRLLTGALEAIESAEVKVPRTRDHRLQIQWLATDGAMVAAGETVLEFDNSSFTANLDQQRTAVQRSRRTLLQIRAQGDARMREADAAVQRARIALAKAELDASVPAEIRSRYDHRNFQLALTKAQAGHDKAHADHRATETSVAAEIQVSEEEYRKAQRELGIAEDAVNALVLTAPRDGIIVVEENPWEDRKFQVGDTVFPGWTVVGIPNLERLRVRASLSDVDDGSLETGVSVRCTPDIEPGLHLEGTISEITPIAREQRVFSERRGFDVTIAIARSPDEFLLVPGMSVRVEADLRIADQLLIPRVAIDFQNRPPTAVLRNGSRVEIALGPCSAHECVLEDGLEEGTRLAPVRGRSS